MATSFTAYSSRVVASIPAIALVSSDVDARLIIERREGIVDVLHRSFLDPKEAHLLSSPEAELSDGPDLPPIHVRSAELANQDSTSPRREWLPAGDLDTDEPHLTVPSRRRLTTHGGQRHRKSREISHVHPPIHSV